MSVNRVIVSGNLTKDPVTRAVGTGIVANFSVAVNDRYKDKTGNLVQTTDYVNVQVFGKLAQTVKNHLCKGRKVLVEGRLKQDKWVAADGQKRETMVVRAEQVEFLDAPKGASAGSTSTARPVAAGASMDIDATGDLV